MFHKREESLLDKKIKDIAKNTSLYENLSSATVADDENTLDDIDKIYKNREKDTTDETTEIMVLLLVFIFVFSLVFIFLVSGLKMNTIVEILKEKILIFAAISCIEYVFTWYIVNDFTNIKKSYIYDEIRKGLEKLN